MALTPPADRPDSAFASIWHAPLAPVALAVTAGVVADRALGLPPAGVVLALGVGLVGWAAGLSKSAAAGLPLLWLACAAAGALHHHQFRSVFATDDVGRLTTAEPKLVRLRGRLAEEPTSAGPAKPDPLRSMPRAEPARAVLAVTQLQEWDDWRPASGRARLVVAGPLDGLHVGDFVEAVGWLSAPGEPANPGEWDPAGHYLDDRITALLSVHKTSDGVVRLAEGWAEAPAGWLAAVRGWGRRALESSLPAERSGVAAALLLGDGSAMAQAEWDKYIRTGVIHALAISGQHLVVLAAFLWLVLRLAGVRRKHGAVAVALVLVAYAALTGGRPPATRAAVMVAVVCGGLVLRRTVLPANAFALAWLVVLVLQPTDVADAGNQLSFLCVAMLTWGTARWFVPREPDPLEKLIDASRPAWVRGLRRAGRWLAVSYGITLVLGLAVMPLVAYRYHLISPAGLLIGPPVVILTSIALVAGFLLLIAAAVVPPLVPVFAWATDWSLRLCGWVVDAADRLPGGCIAVADVPGWWLAVFYAGLLSALILPTVRARWRPLALAGVGWLALGLVLVLGRPSPDGLRVTFLAVGHGGCTVLETPDGRVLLYDAGALAGPDVTRRQIAPFLWHRGVRRIDEVLVSHADLDHFNGLPALLDRFPVGQVTLTPSFADKPTPGVREALAALERSGVRTRVVKAGDRLTAGDVTLDVLHPPPAGPDGNENARSLVLLVRHAGHSLLLTGDLEGPGLSRVLATPPTPVDVLMAPHHGSKAANVPGLAAWCRPRLVVACQGPPPWPTQVPAMYESHGATYLGTWPHGAVTIVSHRTGLVAETFRTHQRIVVRMGGGK
ncbi:MAG TPA: ComEC/Rec2 family competence protein [Gemmataceae bacterium]|jgi:competence protein ComEC